MMIQQVLRALRRATVLCCMLRLLIAQTTGRTRQRLYIADFCSHIPIQMACVVCIHIAMAYPYIVSMGYINSRKTNTMIADLSSDELAILDPSYAAFMDPY